MDIPLYNQAHPADILRGNPATRLLQDRGHFLYKQFSSFIRLMRQGGDHQNRSFSDPFCCVLGMELGHNNDWLNIVQSRVLGRLSEDEKLSFNSATALMCTRKEVRSYNAKYLLSLRSPVYRALSSHSAPPAIMQAVRGLEPALAGDLPPMSLLTIGARMMITKNLWTVAGIVNGAMGTLRGLIPSTEARAPCVSVS